MERDEDPWEEESKTRSGCVYNRLKRTISEIEVDNDSEVSTLKDSDSDDDDSVDIPYSQITVADPEDFDRETALIHKRYHAYANEEELGAVVKFTEKNPVVIARTLSHSKQKITQAGEKTKVVKD